MPHSAASWVNIFRMRESELSITGIGVLRVEMRTIRINSGMQDNCMLTESTMKRLTYSENFVVQECRRMYGTSFEVS